ncbi:hypothetical protein [Nonlabens tegetincola]|uniref:hypothetical protein n=1 Tax=Nonlabens tegetincola TaxID=323273 RepID=UPI0030C83975
MSYSAKPKLWFWILAIIFLLWNLIGVGFFMGELLKPDIMYADFTDEVMEYVENRPWWFMINYGIATIVSFLACVMLLFKSKIAVPLSVIGLVGIVISTIYFFTSGITQVIPGAEQGFTIFILLMGIFLWLFARSSRKKGWLR